MKNLAPTADLSASAAESFRALLARRRSVRAFLPDPVPESDIREIFSLAQWSPSNCNSQPWAVTIVSGATRDRLKDAYLAYLDRGGQEEADVPWLRDAYPPHFAERRSAHARCQQDAFGVGREDVQARANLLRRQLSFFGAPHVALLSMPAWGNEREASDLGMYAQTVLLGLAAYGLAGLPQALLGLYAPPVKEVLGLDTDMKLLFGIAFGYEDVVAPGARLDQPRAPFEAAINILN